MVKQIVPEEVQNQQQSQSLSQNTLALYHHIQDKMGFFGFSSSKGKKHNIYPTEGVRKGKPQRRKYRQYLNRRGGLNRKLDKMT